MTRGGPISFTYNLRLEKPNFGFEKKKDQKQFALLGISKYERVSGGPR